MLKIYVVEKLKVWFDPNDVMIKELKKFAGVYMYQVSIRGGFKARRVWAVARILVQNFCYFLCGNFFLDFFNYLLAIYYINPNKCVAKKICHRLTLMRDGE